MSVWSFTKKQLSIDVINIQRDPLLRYFVFFPLLMVVIIKAFIPLLNTLLGNYGVNLSDYMVLIMSFFFIMMNPVFFGIIIGFLLLDEKDELTLQALQVTPMAMNHYVALKMLIPMVVSVLTSMFVFPLLGVYEIGFFPLLLITIVASVWGPIMALALVTVASNKIEGFALMKALNILLIIPMVAYFVPEPWQYLFGIVPTYWSVKAFWLVGINLLGMWLCVIMSIVMSLLILKLLQKRFARMIIK